MSKGAEALRSAAAAFGAALFFWHLFGIRDRMDSGGSGRRRRRLRARMPKDPSRNEPISPA